MINMNCVPSQSNPKYVNPESANLGEENALFGIPSWPHQPAHSF